MECNISSQEDYAVKFKWGLQGVEALSNEADALIIVDVLSFSTSVSVAVERGASVIPYRSNDDGAVAFAKEQSAILAVQRRDTSEKNPFSLSPDSLKALLPGSKLVLPSPNGSTCCARALELGVKYVLAGCFRNAEATAAAAKNLGKRIAVVAAGEKWADDSLRPAIEDALGAGAILAHLESGAMSPEAAVTMSSYRANKAYIYDIVLESVSGRELRGRGFEQDVRVALEINRSSLAAVFTEGQFNGVKPSLKHTHTIEHTSR